MPCRARIPVWERYPSPDGMFSRSDFTYDAERDVYICANGRLLRASGTVHDGRVRNYLSQPQDCRACTLKQRCTRAPFKKIARDINEDGRIYIELINNPFLKEGGTPDQYRAALARAVTLGWLWLHESGTYVKFTPAGAELFA
jgi:hypothetical protein